MDGIQYLILRFCLWLFFILITSPILLGFGWLMNYFKDHEEYKMAGLIVAVFGLAYLFCLSWFANKTAQHMAFENKKFRPAVKLAFYDLKLRLAFLPLVGHWFAPKPPDKRDWGKEAD